MESRTLKTTCFFCLLQYILIIIVIQSFFETIKALCSVVFVHRTHRNFYSETPSFCVKFQRYFVNLKQSQQCCLCFIGFVMSFVSIKVLSACDTYNSRHSETLMLAYQVKKHYDQQCIAILSIQCRLFYIHSNYRCESSAF